MGMIITISRYIRGGKQSRELKLFPPSFLPFLYRSERYYWRSLQFQPFRPPSRPIPRPEISERKKKILRQSNISPRLSSKSNVLERWFGRRKESRVGRRAPFFVDRRIPTLSVCRHRRRRRQWWWSVPRDPPPRLGRPRLVAHYRPRLPTPFLHRKLLWRLGCAPSSRGARGPNRATAPCRDYALLIRMGTNQGAGVESGRRGGGGGRAREGWRASCRLVQGRRSPRRVTRQGLGEKRPRPWSGSAPPPCVNRNQVSGRNCFLKKRIQQICRKMVSFAL